VSNTLLKKYTETNSIFTKKFVFHLGCEAGFFSEINNMILGILYCLKHKMKFILYSADANFKTEKGWIDFFEPFCEESLDSFHKKWNCRRKNRFRRKGTIYLSILKYIKGVDYLTQDLFFSFHNRDFENEYFEIQELEIKNYLLEACQKIVKMIWNFEYHTQEELNKLINSITLPNEYIGLHIRAGDKYIEADTYNMDDYIQKTKSISNLKHVFVLTDDYKIFEQLVIRYPELEFYTLSQKSQKGYFHLEFDKLQGQEKRKQLIILLASIEILSNSSQFIGTYSSNIGMFLGMKMEKSKIHCLDFENWVLW
jgi:hypothetical protein